MKIIRPSMMAILMICPVLADQPPIRVYHISKMQVEEGEFRFRYYLSTAPKLNPQTVAGAVELVSPAI